MLDAAYDACLPDVDGDPRTIWGWTQGATRISQETKYADERVEADRAAARVLEMAF